MYLDVAIKVLGYDLGWFSFQANKYQATYQYVINTILNKFNDVIPDKNNIEVNKHIFLIVICMTNKLYFHINISLMRRNAFNFI